MHDLAIPGFTLMTNAGTAAADYLQMVLSKQSRLLVLCGPGNNGGDGYVVATQLKTAGYELLVISVSDPDELKSDAARARDCWLQTGEKIQPYDGQLPEADYIIDALFGIGLQRNISGRYQALVEQVNSSGSSVFAIDIPSGLCSDTGSVRGCAVIADTTMTFIGNKRGQWLCDGPDCCGNIFLDDLGLPGEAYPDSHDLIQLLDTNDISARLTPRRQNSHKGNYGHVCLIGGAAGMPGAALIAGQAAARSGAGLVTVLTHEQHAAAMAAACPVLMVHAVRNAADLREAASRASVIAIGPGLGQDRWARDLFAVAMGSSSPLVIDADGLNLLAHNPRQSDQQILTPHPGEAANLLGISSAAVQSDRVAAIQALQDQYAGVIVLKGAGTLIYDGKQMYLCAAGNPGMASGGMGDLLTGILAALLAQGLLPTDAAVVAVLAHAMAGDRAAGSSPRGMIATDLYPQLRELLNP